VCKQDGLRAQQRGGDGHICQNPLIHSDQPCPSAKKCHHHVHADAPKVVPEGNTPATAAPSLTSRTAFTSNPKEMEEARKNLTARVCGSPAVDGYAHVVPKCLEESPTALWWKQYLAKGGKQEDLIAHVGELGGNWCVGTCMS